MLLGAAASMACYGFVGSLKNRLRLDDSLDVFGIHGLGGIVGSIGTAIVALPALGGHGGASYALGTAGGQLAAVAVAIAWSAAGSALCFGAVKAVPLRRDRDEEREGLDLSRSWRTRLQFLERRIRKARSRVESEPVTGEPIGGIQTAPGPQGEQADGTFASQWWNRPRQSPIRAVPFRDG